MFQNPPYWVNHTFIYHKSSPLIGLIAFWLVIIHHSATSISFQCMTKFTTKKQKQKQKTLSYSSLRMSPSPSLTVPGVSLLLSAGSPWWYPHATLSSMESEKGGASRHRWRKFSPALPLKLWNVQSVLLTQCPLLCSKSPEFFHPAIKIL